MSDNHFFLFKCFGIIIICQLITKLWPQINMFYILMAFHQINVFILCHSSSQMCAILATRLYQNVVRFLFSYPRYFQTSYIKTISNCMIPYIKSTHFTRCTPNILYEKMSDRRLKFCQIPILLSQDIPIHHIKIFFIRGIMKLYYPLD